jgi:hypothetical protein
VPFGVGIGIQPGMLGGQWWVVVWVVHGTAWETLLPERRVSDASCGGFLQRLTLLALGSFEDSGLLGLLVGFVESGCSDQGDGGVEQRLAPHVIVGAEALREES